MARKSTGKRLRFEIFKRDGFRCVYCGVTPQQKVLRVDHVEAVASGGASTADNLVTACFDCNAGKAAVPLDDTKLKVGFVRDEDREHAEQIREYLAIQREIHGAKDAAVADLASIWERRIGPMTKAMHSRLPGLISGWPTNKLVEAIEIVAGNLDCDPSADYDWRRATEQAKYFHGVLRRWRREAEPPPPPTPEPLPAPKAPSGNVLRVSRACHAATSAIPAEDRRGRLVALYVAFARASLGNDEDIEGARLVAEGDDPTAYPIEVRGMRLTVRFEGAKGTYWIDDEEGFNPYQHAHAGLDMAIYLSAAPMVVANERRSAMALVLEARDEWNAWISIHLAGAAPDGNWQAVVDRLSGCIAADKYMPHLKRWGLV